MQPTVIPEFKNIYHKPGIELMPHRPPFLFVDEVISADETGSKSSYTYTLEKNDFFKGHFPDYPVVPGVILVETMAQAAGAGLIARGFFGDRKPGFLFAKIENARFRKPVRPGDTFITVCMNGRCKSIVGTFDCKGYVNGELAAEGTLTCVLGTEKQK